MNFKNLNKEKIKNNKINIININFFNIKIKNNNIKSTNNYINKCFDIAFKILKSGYTNKFINGPINKKKFLNKKFLGITEFISSKFKIKNNAMLIYNKNLSVCQIKTHLHLKNV